MNSTLPKALLWGLGGAFVLLVLSLALSAPTSLQVEYQNGLLKVQNVGSEPIKIEQITVNDRTDCTLLDILPSGRTLRVGDYRVLMTSCDVVRTTIKTDHGTETFSFGR